VRIGGSRSSKVVDFGTNRKGVSSYALSILINSNFDRDEKYSLFIISFSAVSGGMRFMLIFAEVPWGGASNDNGVIDNGNYFQRFHWLFL